MISNNDPTLDVIVSVVVQDGKVIGATTVVNAEANLVQADGTVDDLVNRIAARRIAEAQMLIRRSRNR